MTSIFVDLGLPNSPTWFYFSLVIAVALLFQFTRIASVRNLDLLGLYMFIPGFLLIQEAHDYMSLVQPDYETATTRLYFGYIWLMAVTGLWGIRAILDPVLKRRPNYRPNLSLPAMSWFSIAIFLGLCTVQARKPVETPVHNVVAQPTRDTALVEAATNKPLLTPAKSTQNILTKVVAMLCHLSVALGLLFIGIFHFRDAENGLSMTILYLLLPVTAYFFGDLEHVVLSSTLIWAIFAQRVPWLSGGLLGLATGLLLFPVIVVPLWLRYYWRKGWLRFVLGFLGLACLGFLVRIAFGQALPGVFPSMSPQYLSDWLPWKETNAEGIWGVLPWAYRLPVSIVYAVTCCVLYFWPRMKNINHLIAFSAALLLGLQFWYAQQGGIYLLWYLPLLLLIIFRPAQEEFRSVGRTSESERHYPPDAYAGPWSTPLVTPPPSRGANF